MRPLTLAKTSLLASLWFSAAFVRAQGLPPGTSDAADAPRLSDSDLRLRDAEQSLERGDTKSAQAQLQKLALEQPANAQVQYDLGFAAEQNGDDVTARKAYVAAAIADKTMAEAFVALGLLDARTGVEVEQGTASLRAGAALPEATPALRARAYRALAVLDDIAHPADAATELAAAIQLSSETPEDILFSAEMAERAGDLGDAEAAYLRAAQHPENTVDANLGLARVYRKENKLTEAETTLAQVKQQSGVDPRSPASLQIVEESAALAAAENHPAEAAALLSSSTSADPGALRQEARLYAEANDAPHALPLYQKLLAATPNDPVLLDEYGGVLVKAQRYAEAQAVLSKAFNDRAAFSSPETWAESAGHLAFAASKNHQPQLCLQALAARATVLPNTPASLFLQATAQDTLHQYKDAAASYRAFLVIADEKNYSNESFEARHRLIALEHMM